MAKRWAVLLDAGGVILDETVHEQVQADLLVEAIAEIVPGYTVDDYHQDVDAAVQNYVPRVYRSVIYQRTGFDRDVTERIWAAHLQRWRAQRPDLRLMPGISGVIRNLGKDFDLALAGQYGAEVTECLRENDLLAHFTCGLHQGHYEVTKPDPRFFEQVAAQMGTDHAHCIVVGDRIDKDVIPARQCGMHTILVQVGLHRNQKPRLPEENADVVLPDVTDLAAAIRALAAATADA